jgi:hypothetical protein
MQDNVEKESMPLNLLSTPVNDDNAKGNLEACLVETSLTRNITHIKRQRIEFGLDSNRRACLFSTGIGSDLTR